MEESVKIQNVLLFSSQTHSMKPRGIITAFKPPSQKKKSATFQLLLLTPIQFLTSKDYSTPVVIAMRDASEYIKKSIGIVKHYRN